MHAIFGLVFVIAGAVLAQQDQQHTDSVVSVEGSIEAAQSAHGNDHYATKRRSSNAEAIRDIPWSPSWSIVIPLVL